MDEPFLIAHKVRGEPAFDIAIKQPCAICQAHAQAFDDGSFTWGCDECDGEGHWWIISTSGHRAYPYYTIKLEYLIPNNEGTYHHGVLDAVPPMPDGVPDHYTINVTKSKPESGRSLLALLGLGRKPQSPIRRRV